MNVDVTGSACFPAGPGLIFIVRNKGNRPNIPNFPNSIFPRAFKALSGPFRPQILTPPIVFMNSDLRSLILDKNKQISSNFQIFAMFFSTQKCWLRRPPGFPPLGSYRSPLRASVGSYRGTYLGPRGAPISPYRAPMNVHQVRMKSRWALGFKGPGDPRPEGP